MENRYRDMFDEVRASDTLRQEVLRMQNQENGRRTRRRLPVAGLAAAVLAVVLAAGTALAVASPSLRDWFARRWAEGTGGEISESQALLIDSLTQKVGESRTVGEVTVTVDSITVGGDALWALVDVEGLDFDADKAYSFDQTDIEIQPDPSEGAPGVMGCSIGSIGLTEDAAVRMLLEFSGIFPTGNQINAGGYTLELRLRDLTLCRRAGEPDEIIYEGEWSFSIPLTESMVPTIAIDSAVVELGAGGEDMEDAAASSGVTITLRDIRVTATGLSFYTAYSDDEAAERVQMAALSYLEVAVILSDGTEVLSNGSGGSQTEGGGWYCTSQWPVPIDVEDVMAIRIGGTEIPVPQNG